MKNNNSKMKAKFLSYRQQHSLLKTITAVSCVIAFVAYVVILIVLINNKIAFKEIVEITANYATVFALFIGSLQLIAFVDDARHKEVRARKEAAVSFAREYAKNLLPKISIIENILSQTYNPKDPHELKNDVLEPLIITNFTKGALESNNKLKTYTALFQNRTYPIESELILEKYNSLGKIHIPPKGNASDDKYKEILNKSFKSILIRTLNELEQFAMAVNQNVAESKILFPSLHETYLQFVKYSYPYICLSNLEYEKFYTNIIQLYRTWLNQKQFEEQISRERSKNCVKDIETR